MPLPIEPGEHPNAWEARVYNTEESIEHLRVFRERRPFDGWVATIWLHWLSLTFESPPSQERLDTLISALRVRRFSNLELWMAAEWCEEHCRRFPVLADFGECPVIERNTDPLR